MAHYRKIDVRIWNDAKFRDLSDPAKFAFFFILTHPSLTCLGAMRATVAGLAQELGWTTAKLRRALFECATLELCELNERSAYICARNFIKYNQPQGPNSVVKAWKSALELLPECPEREALIMRARACLDSKPKEFRRLVPASTWYAFGGGIPSDIVDGIRDGIDDGIRDPSDNQDLNPDLHQDPELQDKTLGAAPDLVITVPAEPTAPAAGHPDAAPDHPDPEHLAEAIALCRADPYLAEMLDPAETVARCARAHPELDPLRVVQRMLAWLSPEQVAIQRKKGKGASKCLVSYFDIAARQAHEQHEGPPGGVGRQVGLSQTELLAEYERRQRGTA